jgi:hypothetical protein
MQNVHILESTHQSFSVIHISRPSVPKTLDALLCERKDLILEHPGSRHKIVTNVCFQAISRLDHEYTSRHPVPRRLPPTCLRHGSDMSTTRLRQGYDMSTTSTTCLRHLRHVYDIYDLSTTSTTWLRHLRHATKCYDMLRHATTCYDSAAKTTLDLHPTAFEYNRRDNTLK